jgi:hypothetical protein
VDDDRPLRDRCRDLTKRVAELEGALTRALDVAQHERRLRAAAEDSARRAWHIASRT